LLLVHMAHDAVGLQVPAFYSVILSISLMLVAPGW
jgi:hypothetical protein